jgi:Rrf2 family nitric oxide-sensitive transcriptional repressor
VLPKTAEYALRAVVWLAKERDSAASADVLSQATQTPRRYLHKVLQDLVRGGIVRSQPGPGGGYLLAVSPEETSILDVVHAVAPLERIRQCPLGISTHTELCPLHQALDQAYAATEAAFGRITLAQLVESTSSIVPLCAGKTTG